MSERRLAAELVTRFSRVAWATIAAYAVVVVLVFGIANELQLRRSLERSADVIESLLGLYADPEGSPTTVAPDMLADQLVGMGARFAITRTAGAGETSAVYFLSPTMPAKRLEGLTAAASPEDVRHSLLQAIAARARWRYRVLHRNAGAFDIYVVASRAPGIIALAVLVAAALGLLPAAVLLARRRVQRSVAGALAPLERVAAQTHSIGPDDLGRRLEQPSGQMEVTALTDSINRMLGRVDRAHRALESFTADASHELRTPLTHIQAQAQWAQAEGRTPEEMREAFSAIERELERTTKMVEDLFLIARGENRQLQMDRREFDLTSVVQEVCEVGQAMAEGRNLDLRVEMDGQVMAFGDADRTRHILLNLLTNAVRYTAQGSICLAVRADDAMVAVEVRDTGPGIAAEHLGKIFDRFYRVEGSRSRALGGGGLGLTIAQLLAELQGGEITVESKLGEGSSFTLWLPAGDGGEEAAQ